MISYIKFMKHAAKVTKNVGSRPILKGVLHQKKDGSLIVTDSHRLYKAVNAYNGTEDKVIDPITGDFLDREQYPETSRLIPTNPKTEIDIGDLGRVTAVLKSINELTRYSYKNDKPDKKDMALADLVSDGKHLSLINRPGYIAFSYLLALGANIEEFHQIFRVNYLAEAFDLFRDAGYEQVTLQFFGNMRPIIIKSPDLLALIMPVRTY